MALLFSDSMVYIIVVSASATSDYFTSLIESSDLEIDDPPPVCMAPASGRFEVNEACVGGGVMQMEHGPCCNTH